MTRNSTKRSSAKLLVRSFPRLSGEAKVKLAADMSSTVAEVTMNSIQDRHPGISRPELFKLTRRRLQKRPRVWMNDAVPYFAEGAKPKLSDLAHTWKMSNRDTEEVLKGLKRFWSRWKKA